MKKFKIEMEFEVIAETEEEAIKESRIIAERMARLKDNRAKVLRFGEMNFGSLKQIKFKEV